MQGMAFLSRYRALRKSSPEGFDEIEFNFGRAFQQLGLQLSPPFLEVTETEWGQGLHSHAVQHYERVLDLQGRKLLNVRLPCVCSRCNLC